MKRYLIIKTNKKEHLIDLDVLKFYHNSLMNNNQKKSVNLLSTYLLTERLFGNNYYIIHWVRKHIDEVMKLVNITDRDGIELESVEGLEVAGG